MMATLWAVAIGGWMLTPAAAVTDAPFVYTPPLSQYKAVYAPSTEGELKFWGDGLARAVTGQVSSFTVEVHNTTLLRPGSYLGMYATLESASTVLGMYASAAPNRTSFLFEYEPIIPGEYTLVVDLIRYGPSEALAPLYGLKVSVTGADLFNAEQRSSRCDGMELSRGDWIKCDSTQYQALAAAVARREGEDRLFSASGSCLRWGGMAYVPRTCHWDVYAKTELRDLATRSVQPWRPTAPPLKERVAYAANISLANPMTQRQNSIVFLGSSITRGIMFGLADHVLGEWNSEMALQKCWGQMFIRYRELSITYQDLRGLYYGSWPSFQQQNQRSYECHNDHVSVDYFSLEQNTTLFMRNLFASNPTTVVFQFIHIDGNFTKTGYVMKNLLQVPSWWKGNLIGLFTRDAPNNVMDLAVLTMDAERSWSALFGRPVRVLDALDIVKPMLRHQEYGIMGVSSHWGHSRAFVTGDVNMFGVVQDAIAQFILNVHFGKKAALQPPPARAQNVAAFSAVPPRGLEVCFDCPPTLVPFHTQIMPHMTCHANMPTEGQYVESHKYFVSCPAACMKVAPFATVPVHGGGFIEARRCNL